MTQVPDRTRLRVAFLGIVFLSLFSALVLRLWFLQILTHETFAHAAELNQVRYVPIEPTRGNILDRNGEVLVTNRPSRVVSIRPDELRSKKVTIAKLSQVLGMTTQQIEARLADKNVSPYTAVPIKEDVPKETLFYIREHSDEFPGVIDETRPVRVYPKGTLASHLLGSVGEINADQLKKDAFREYQAGALIGRGGLEAAYESDLYGKPGTQKLEVNSAGKVTASLSRREPVKGHDLVTTIDARVQAIAEQSLSQGIEKVRTVIDKQSQKHYLAPAGGAVVMDPKTGEVIAMASYPTFDPSVFVGGISQQAFKALSDDPAHPLINRVTQAAFPPGSTFKAVTAAAALQDGIAARGGHYNCPASYRFRDRTFHNWKTSDSGTISVPQALIESCDTVFYQWGAEFYKRFAARQGEKLQDYARQFGFGSPTGIETGDKPGRVPDEAWLKEQHKLHPKLFPNTVWLPGFTINMSIGQGDVLTTPLQLASAYAAVANGGTIFKPHVGLRLAEDGKEVRKVPPITSRKVQVAQGNWDVIRQGLQGVPTVGTARGAFGGFPFDKVSVAAKTGTAELQTVPPQQPYAWFASYAPANDPKYVVIVMLEQGGHGGEGAAPIARRIIEGLFGLPLSDITPAARTD